MSQAPNIVITIARQLGAGGTVLGERLARRLGFAYLDRQILRLAAKKAGVSHESLENWDERASGFWDRFVDCFAIGPAEGIYSSVMTIPTVRDDQLFEIESRTIREVVSRRSAIIIGRGGFWILKDHPATIRVLLHSPAQARIATVRKAFSLGSDAEARAKIDEVDAERARFIEAMTGRSVTDARNYDLAINTQTVSMDAAEDLVLRLVDEMRGHLHPLT